MPEFEGKHWNPGNYVFPDHNGTQQKDPSIIGAINAVNAQSGNQYIRGVQVALPWARIEPTLGNYNFATAYDWISRITQSGTNNKRVGFSVVFQTYGGGVPTAPQNVSTAIAPDYLIPTYVGAGNGGGFTVKLGMTYARDRLIALMTALANEFGNHPSVEWITVGETSRAFVGQTSAETAAYDNAWNYIATTLAPIYASKKAWLCIENNALSSTTLTNSLQDTMDLNKIGYGAPDINTFYTNATPPGPAMDASSGGAQYTTLYRMNFGDTKNQSPTNPRYPPSIINSSNLDRRLYTLSKPENQVVRSKNLKNSDIKWYIDNWFKATHPVWTLRIGAGGSYYPDYYVSPEVQSITGTNPIQITLSSNFVATGEYVSFRSIGGPYSFLNSGGYYLATRISDRVITIPVNGTALGAWAGYGVCAVRAPYDFSGTGTLQYLCQAASQPQYNTLQSLSPAPPTKPKNNSTLQPQNGGYALYKNSNNGILDLDGVDDYISTSVKYLSSEVQNFTIACWIRTNDIRGRKIIGFERGIEFTNNYDRHLYIGVDGKLYFGVYNQTQGIRYISSSETVDDNYWHYVVGSFGNGILKLYVDGELVSQGTATSAESFDGYWIIGGYRLSYWPNASAAGVYESIGFLRGSIASAHVYNRALTDNEVLSNYNAKKIRFMPLSGPTISATPISGTQIQLAISHPDAASSAITGYVIQRSVSSTGPWLTLSNPTKDYTDNNNVLPNTQYYYRCKFSQTDAKTSAFGTTVSVLSSSAVTQPDPPTIKLTLLSTSSIQITVNAITADNLNPTNYIIERSIDGTSGWSVVYNSSAAIYADSNLTVSTKYYYRAKFTQQNGQTSLYSSTQNQTTFSTPTTLRINVGGGTYTDTNQNAWVADQYFNAGTNIASTAADIAGTTNDVIFRTNRWDSAGGSAMTYDIPVVNGAYQVVLHFAEIYNNAFGNGLRVFDVTINGAKVLENFDVFATAGATTALSRIFTTTATNSKITIVFSAEVENPFVSGIEIVPVSAGVPPEIATAPPLSNKIKWNPGHYVRADEQSWIAKRPNRFAVYETIRNVPQIKGASFSVNWGMVENQLGVYDWSVIDAEIEKLASMNKKIIMDIWYQSFGGGVPKGPQGADYRYVGDYLIAAGYVASSTDGGYGARFDIPECMDRYLALIQAIAARYDSNPHVESVRVTETSIAFSGLDREKLAEQWLRVPPVLKAAFNQTHTMIYNNFLVDVPSSRALTAAMVANGVGMGGPDIIGTFRLPQSNNYLSHGAQEIRGAGVVTFPDGAVGTFGTVDNRARVPQSWEAQVVRPRNLTPADVNDVANNVLKCNHIIWTAYYGYSPIQYKGTVEVPTMRWEGTNGVLAYLKLDSSKVTNTACPISFGGRCSS